jgi:hypothetical protein
VTARRIETHQGTDEEIDPVCLICGDSFSLSFGSENDGLCHPCAHAEVDRLREKCKAAAAGEELCHVLVEAGEKADATIAELRVEVDRLQTKVRAMQDALVWCSGSNDFSPGGQARDGWLKLVAPLLGHHS